MFQYTVKETDKLSKIIFAHQTTKPVLANINPGVNLDKLTAGMVLNIETRDEYMSRVATKASTAVAASNKAQQNLIKSYSVVSASGRTTPTEPINTPEGYIKFKTDGSIYQLSNTNLLVKKGIALAGQRFAYYSYLNSHGGLYALNGVNRYVKASDVVISNVQDAEFIQDVSTNKKGSVTSDAITPNIPQFEMAGYKRTKLKVKKPDGNYLTIEMRVTGFVPNYTNQFTPSRTNAGWMMAVGGENLLSISITGFWLDTYGNPEARDFARIYKNYLVPKNNADYFSSEIVTIVHKSWEYKGVIQSFTMPDDAQTPLDRKFQMQFLSLSDRPISRDEQNSQFKDVVKRDLKDNRENEQIFFSDISKMLSNPLNGLYFNDPE